MSQSLPRTAEVNQGHEGADLWKAVLQGGGRARGDWGVGLGGEDGYLLLPLAWHWAKLEARRES